MKLSSIGGDRRCWELNKDESPSDGVAQWCSQRLHIGMLGCPQARVGVVGAVAFGGVSFGLAVRRQTLPDESRYRDRLH